MPAFSALRPAESAESQDRTGDTMIFSHVLYQLSYLGLAFWMFISKAKPILPRSSALVKRNCRAKVGGKSPGAPSKPLCILEGLLQRPAHHLHRRLQAGPQLEANRSLVHQHPQSIQCTGAAGLGLL
jgi:hypothetical protein